MCTPPTDPAFLATAHRAFAEADRLLSGEIPVLVGMMVRIRFDYPNAWVLSATVVSGDAQPLLLWLIARDGWAGIADGASAPPDVLRYGASLAPS
jgi:hypothetical protein